MNVVVTGATGLIGLHTVRRLVARGVRPIVLARGQAAGSAELDRLAASGLVRFMRADLEAPNLGLSVAERRRLAEAPAHVVNCAGYYRLSGEAGALTRTNVDGLAGLIEVFDQAGAASLHHVSSVVAAGATDGWVEERPLGRPHRFRNAYEESKWAAEDLLLRRWRRALRIYRPGIVIGDSLTGETSKFDGPYAAFGLARRWLPFPVPGDGRQAFPLVNVDLVADALVAGVERLPGDVAEVVNVVDTEPLSVRSFADAITERLVGRPTALCIPAPILAWAGRLPGLERFTGLEPEALAYMSAEWRFETENLRRLLDGSGASSARVRRSLDAVVAYYRLQRGSAPPAGSGRAAAGSRHGIPSSMGKATPAASLTSSPRPGA